jgi:hypothetical protein
MDLQEAFDAGFLAVKTYVDDALTEQRAALGGLVKAAVAEAVAALPEAKDGADGADGLDGKDAEPISDEQIAGAVATWFETNPVTNGVDGRDGTDGVDGKDAEPIDYDRIGTDVRAWLEANPPANGKDGRDGVDGKDGSPGEKGVDGADGIGLASALIDREGNLVLTNTAGATFPLGKIVGSDGRDGKDGEVGPAGRDALALTDFDTELSEDGRILTLKLENDAISIRHELELPVMVFRGVWREGEYRQGDTVQFGGGMFHCTRTTTEKPTEGAKDWTLAVRRGRDGKDGKDGERGAEGKQGPAGRDLTQMGPNGSKW